MAVERTSVCSFASHRLVLLFFRANGDEFGIVAGLAIVERQQDFRVQFQHGRGHVGGVFARRTHDVGGRLEHEQF